MGWRDEVLMDVQAPTAELGATEKRMIDLITRTLAGTVIVWCSVNDLLLEVVEYRRRRTQRKGGQ